jgi:hypothetical protein
MVYAASCRSNPLQVPFETLCAHLSPIVPNRHSTST